jgi:hypothetical protein
VLLGRATPVENVTVYVTVLASSTDVHGIVVPAMFAPAQRHRMSLFESTETTSDYVSFISAHAIRST